MAEKGKGYESVKTPVLDGDSLEAFRLLSKMQVDEEFSGSTFVLGGSDDLDSLDDLDNPNEIVTRPVPRSLMLYFAVKSREVLKGSNGSDDALAEQVITALDPLINVNAPSQKIYDALHKEMEKTEDITDKNKMWDMTIMCLEATMNEILKLIKERGKDGNLMEIEGYLRACWNKVITPSLRVDLVENIKYLIASAETEKEKNHISNAFVLSIINILTQSEKDLVLDVSDATMQGFSYKGKSFAPIMKYRTPEAFQFSYPQSGGKVYEYLINCEEGPESVVQNVLEYLEGTQDLAIIPENIGSLDEHAFSDLCKTHFIAHNKFSKSTKSKELKGAILAMWNMVIGPQLMMLGELKFSRKFLLPEVSAY